MTDKPATPPTPIEAHLSLAEKFAREAREGFCLARVLRIQAETPRIERAPDPMLMRALGVNGSQHRPTLDNPQERARQQAHAVIDAANQNVMNILKVAEELAPLFGLRLTVTAAPKPGE